VEPNTNIPAFGPLVETCRAHGISKTVAFELAANGLLDTFKIGARRYCYLDSLRSLPQRLQGARKATGAAA